MWVLTLGAAAVSGVFAAILLKQWFGHRRPQLLAWGIALAMFSVASGAAALGMLADWTPSIWRTYYLFGAIVNVPVLALGTVYVLFSRRIGHLASVVVALASVYAVCAVWKADLYGAALDVTGIPAGSEVFSNDVRMLARYYSFVGFFIVAGGALFSSWRLSKARSDHFRRLAVGNGLIAAGTFVVALGSGFAFYGEGIPFALGLLLGVSMMFWGFLRTRGPRPAG